MGTSGEFHGKGTFSFMKYGNFVTYSGIAAFSRRTSCYRVR